jgi:hypothetical protein
MVVFLVYVRGQVVAGHRSSFAISSFRISSLTEILSRRETRSKTTYKNELIFRQTCIVRKRRAVRGVQNAKISASTFAHRVISSSRPTALNVSVFRIYILSSWFLYKSDWHIFRVPFFLFHDPQYRISFPKFNLGSYTK